MTSDRKPLQGLYVTVRALAFYEGGHLLATYRVTAAPEAFRDALEACAEDLRTRLRGWELLRLTIYSEGREVYPLEAANKKVS